ncbi:hypothetical protein [Streptomyces sp. LN549]|uniref:hypothetical protein n=1 Tax=Streptomyces sp. LN549 TaxID=3112979 RepID=UPI0037225E50
MKALKGLRPYTAAAPLIRIATGLLRLSFDLLVRCMDGPGFEKLWRALGVLLAVGTLYRAAAAYPMAMIPVTLLLAVLSWRAGEPKPKAEEPEQSAEQPGEQPEQAPLTGAELTAALHEIGSPHAHLAALATHLNTTPTRVREGCSLAGIPVAGGVRMKGRGVSTGVREKDFPPLRSPDAAPSEGVVAAGQSTTTTATAPTVVRSAEGALITVTPAREEVA